MTASENLIALVRNELESSMSIIEDLSDLKLRSMKKHSAIRKRVATGISKLLISIEGKTTFVPARDAVLVEANNSASLTVELKSLRDSRWAYINHAYRYLQPYNKDFVPTCPSIDLPIDDVRLASFKLSQAIHDFETMMRLTQNKNSSTRATNGDTSEKSDNKFPKTKRGQKLCDHLKKHLSKFPTRMDCIRDFCVKQGIPSNKAKNLDPTAIRFRHLWEK